MRRDPVLLDIVACSDNQGSTPVFSRYDIVSPKRGTICAFTLITIGVTLLYVACVDGYAFQEAPVLKEQVARGELPPVESRLPEEPAVVEPVDRIGSYGGTWRRVSMGRTDIQLNVRLGYEPLVRWDRSGLKPVPGLAKAWEVLDGGRTYVFHLRRGLKWSDGELLTSEDFLFYFEDILLNKELTPIFPAWLALDGIPPEVSAPDSETIVIGFPKPYGIFLEAICFRGMSLFAPKHYLCRFHPKYTPLDEIMRQVRQRGLSHWFQLFQLKSNLDENPELPTYRPFQIVVPPPATRMVARRNPFYWKVDPAGNQLPYIDEIVYMDVADSAMTTFKAMSGEVDFQARRIDAANYPLFMENRHRGNYRVLRDLSPDTLTIYVNQYSKDDEIRPILQDRRFRIALSIGLNRKELIDVIFNGMAVPSRGVTSPFDPVYLPEFDAKYLEYDPDEARRLLDEVGLINGRDGIRRLPQSGRPFRETITVFPSEMGTNMDMYQLISDYWREIGLDSVVKMDAPALSVMQMQNGNYNFWAYALVGMHWMVDPAWYVPWESSSYFAPLYGKYRATNGKAGVKPPLEFQRLTDLYVELRAAVEFDRRVELGREIMRQWAEECYAIGICRPELLTICSNRFQNVPDHIIHNYRVMTPGYIGIEQFFIEEAEQVSR